jgi:adenylate cyclase
MDVFTRQEAAARTGVPDGFIGRLIELHLLSPGPDGTFSPGDLRRSRFLYNLDGGGLGVEAVSLAVAAGELSFDFFDAEYWNRFGQLTHVTLAQLSADTGISIEMLQIVRESLGYARPDPGDRVREDELGQVELLKMGIAAGADPAALERQVRVWGESLRRIAEADANFYHTQIEIPLLKTGMSQKQMLEMGSQAGQMMAPLLDHALLGMYHGQSEHTWMANVIEAVQSALEKMGLYRPPPTSPAVCFLDLTGFTRLTEERGDDEAARLAASLTDQVYRGSGRYGGRPVKWLGDGVMIFFEKPERAVNAAVEMVEQIPESGLPPAHVGIESGPVVLQDGDYFGRTVNTAARIAGRAGAGEVLVSENIIALEVDAAIRFVDVGPVDLKGIDRPVRLYRAARDS